MVMNDLEQLLKQYGEDQRLQDSMADKLRRKARLQRRWAAIVGCVVIMSAIGLAIWNPEPLPQTEIIVAENNGDNAAIVEPGAAPTSKVLASIPQVAEKHKESATSQMIPAEENIEQPKFDEYIAQLQPTPVEGHTHDSTSAPLDMDDSYIDYQTFYLAKADGPETDSRLRFSAMLGVNTTGASVAEWNTQGGDLGTSEYGLDAHRTFSAKPLQMLRGNVGVTYTLVDNRRSRMEAGVSVEGFWHRADVVVSTTQKFEIKGNRNPGGYSVNVSKRTSVESLCGINVGLPLRWSYFPKGDKKTGWMMSVFPAYNLMTSKYMGTTYGHGVNVWKLELSLGVVLPKGIVKNISATANLLPLYQHCDLHEIGVSIGF